MTAISGLGPLSRTTTAPAPRRRADSFRLADPAPAAATCPAAGVAPLSLLALQEDDDDAVADRAARRHGQALLDALTAVQRGLLDPDGGGAALDRLAALARAMPEAADPRLAFVQKAIQIRAAVELARRRAPPNAASA